MADPPYRVGDTAVLIAFDRDSVTVHQTRIEAVEQMRDGWVVVDDRANVHEVDQTGEGVYLVPLSAELEHEFAAKGDGFVVVQEGRLLEPEIVEPTIDQSLDHDLGGDDLGR